MKFKLHKNLGTLGIFTITSKTAKTETKKHKEIKIYNNIFNAVTLLFASQ